MELNPLLHQFNPIYQPHLIFIIWFRLVLVYGHFLHYWPYFFSFVVLQTIALFILLDTWKKTRKHTWTHILINMIIMIIILCAFLQTKIVWNIFLLFYFPSFLMYETWNVFLSPKKNIYGYVTLIKMLMMMIITIFNVQPLY